MQCDNCGYIFFQPSKKCACCSAPYAPAPSAFDVGQENLFTIFEMAPGEGGISGGMGMAGAGVEDYNFTDDFDTGESGYGADDNVLDLSDAEAEGFGPAVAAAGPMSVDDFDFDTSGMDGTPSMDNAGADNFDLNLPDDSAGDEMLATETPELEAEADDAADMDFGGGFDEVEGLGFGFDESPAEQTPEAATEEVSLDAAPEPEAEISMEPELDLDDEQPSLELSDEPELDVDDGQPSLELSEEPSLELPEDLDLDTSEMNAVEEESSMELPDEFDLDSEEMGAVEEESSLELPDDLDLSDEPELMETEEYSDTEDDEGIEFDLDSVNLDEPEDVSYEVPEADTGDDEISYEVPEADAGDDGVTYEVPEADAGDEEPSMDFDGLELEMESPEEPEDEDFTK